MSVKVKMPERKPCIFIGSSLKDLRRFPAKVKNRVGFALDEVQKGEEPAAAKALRGFGGRTVLELVDDFDSDTYRTVYTGRFAGAVYVLHAFQKKAKKALPRRSKILNWSDRDCAMLNRIIAIGSKEERSINDEAQDRGS